MKTNLRQKAIKLRKKGFSLAEISHRLKISKSTASLWSRNILIGQKGKDRVNRNLQKARTKSKAVLHQKKLDRLSFAQEKARELLRDIEINKNTSLIALSAMYLCEGDKNNTRIAFTNSDPNLIRAFMFMLQSVFVIKPEKLRINVHLHDYHDEKEILSFWSSVTNVPLSQFTKTYIKASNHLFKKEGYKGCVRILYHDAHLSRVILSFAKNLVKLYI